MVSTRSHPREFPPPTPIAHRSPRDSTRSASPASSGTPTKVMTPTPSSPSPSPLSTSPSTWQHTPSQLTLLWLAISLPLVLWDTGYVLGRPYTMPGGSLHWPLYVPYALYGTVDHFYGWPAWQANDGFTGAQGLLNLVETAGYVWYLWVVWKYGKTVQEKGKGRGKGRGAPKEEGVAGQVLGSLTRARVVGGRMAALATVVGFAVAVMTLSKTALYWLNEVFSGFTHVGHNDFMSLVFLWIIPNGAWLIFPSYMIYVFGQEIVQGLEASTGESRKEK